MGQQRRIIDDLERSGFRPADEKELYTVVEAIERLTGAGDDFSNALWDPETQGVSIKPEHLNDLLETAERHLAAVEKIVQAVEG